MLTESDDSYEGMTETQLSVRLTEETRDRAEALAEKLAASPAYKGLRMTRAAVVRMAIEVGLEALEKQHGRKRRGR